MAETEPSGARVGCTCHACEDARESYRVSVERAQADAARRRGREDARRARCREQLARATERGYWGEYEGEGKSEARGDGPTVRLEGGSLCVDLPAYPHPTEWARLAARVRAVGGYLGELPSVANRLIPSTYRWRPMRSFEASVSTTDLTSGRPLDAAHVSRLAKVLGEAAAQLWQEIGR
jgi:hypothetical protein